MLYNFEDVQTFIDFMDEHSGASQSEASIGRLAGLLRPVVERYKELSDDDQYTVRDYIRKFNGAYSYIAQLVRLHDKELFNEFQYTNNLIRLLPRGRVEIVDIEDYVRWFTVEREWENWDAPWEKEDTCKETERKRWMEYCENII